MGALAPRSPWILEDDISLKNAVEAGASLESLAKGAVRFSRRFTIQELQDRWHSLLYDPAISAEASARMVDFELSAPNLSLKQNRSDNSKVNDWAPEKRKVESVRSHYYAMRKRICNEPCNSIDLDFLVAPSANNCIDYGDGCQEQLAHHDDPPSRNCILLGPMSNHFQLQETDFDIIHQAFPQMVSSDSPANSIGNTVDAFQTGHMDSPEDDLPDEIMGRDGLYGFAEHVPPVSVEEAVGSGIRHFSEYDNVHEGIPHILGENLSVFGSCTGPQETGPPQTLPVGCLFETDGLETKPISCYDSIDNHQANGCSGFGGSQGFSLPVLDCSGSFNQLEYSSPSPGMPIWGTVENVSSKAMPDASFEIKGQVARDTLVLSDDDGKAKKMHTSGCDVVHLESDLRERVSGHELASSSATSEGEFVDLSNSLLNFENDEDLLFMNEDGKDIMDRSCLDPLLLGSPNKIHQDYIPNITEPNASSSADACLLIPTYACSGGLGDISDSVVTGHAHENNVCVMEINVPSSIPPPTPHFPELHDVLIHCTLNTQDFDVPCNDHIFLPTQVHSSFDLSVTRQNSEEAINPPSSIKKFDDIRKATEQGLSLTKEERETSAQPLSASRMIRSQSLPEMAVDQSVDGCGIKSELLDSDSPAIVSRHAKTAGLDPSQCGSAPLVSRTVPVWTLKEGIKKVESGRHCEFDNSMDSYVEKPVDSSNHVKSHPQNVARGRKQEVDMPDATQLHVSSNTEPSPTEIATPKPVVDGLTSDQEEQLWESDDDVPYFSDIEAMILDMDLGPDAQDSFFNRKVARYQLENAKRRIVRLEQGACSNMQRDIASHGAFAILYGRRLKHYIKKPEVLLGRATDDFNVDIDLGREGRANKVSRRQAIIKMDEDGNFFIKNLGQFSILINNKEVATRQRLNLSSSCLIEIGGMKFIFEINKKSVR